MKFSVSRRFASTPSTGRVQLMKLDFLKMNGYLDRFQSSVCYLMVLETFHALTNLIPLSQAPRPNKTQSISGKDLRLFPSSAIDIFIQANRSLLRHKVYPCVLSSHRFEFHC